MNNCKKYLVFLILFTVISNVSFALSLDFIKRGFKHCTGTCDVTDMCPMDQDETFRWCVKNCSHKIDVKKLCEDILPLKMRPILPYEIYAGSYSTNAVSPIALETIDRKFIEQTTDRRRVMGTVKLIMLIREQVLNGKNVQISSSEREKLADKLMRDYLKFAPQELAQYEKTGTIPDDKLAFIVKELQTEILGKLRQTKWLP